MGGALRRAAERLAASGADAPRLAARVLMRHATGRDAARQIADPDAPLGAAERRRLERALRRREAREPLAYIVGRREFWSLEFAVGPGVLVPRPDSETVVSAALARMRAAPRRVLDAGTGSGCLLLALLSEWPGAFGVGVDSSLAAARAAAANARALGLAERCAFAVSDWTAAVGGAFDVIVCNPPYIPRGALAGLAPEVAREPRAALDGGADGLACYRALLPGAARRLRPGGLIVLEIGEGAERPVRALLRAAGFRAVAVRRDLAGRPRALSARLPGAPAPWLACARRNGEEDAGGGAGGPGTRARNVGGSRDQLSA